VIAEPPGISVVDIAHSYAGFAGGAPKDALLPWAEPCTVPADGTAGVPTGSRAEQPTEPVPDLGRRGFPIMAIFRPDAELEGFS
jgi:hypothetical protein